MRSQQRPRGGAAQQQRQRGERDRQMTGAEDERPDHPRHAPILERSRIGDLARLHHAFFRLMTTKPTAIAATTARHAAIIGSMVDSQKSRRSRVSAALYSNADASTALVTNP